MTPLYINVSSHVQTHRQAWIDNLLSVIFRPLCVWCFLNWYVTIALLEYKRTTWSRLFIYPSLTGLVIVWLPSVCSLEISFLRDIVAIYASLKETGQRKIIRKMLSAMRAILNWHMHYYLYIPYMSIIAINAVEYGVPYHTIAFSVSVSCYFYFLRHRYLLVNIFPTW